MLKKLLANKFADTDNLKILYFTLIYGNIIIFKNLLVIKLVIN